MEQYTNVDAINSFQGIRTHVLIKSLMEGKHIMLNNEITLAMDMNDFRIGFYDKLDSVVNNDLTFKVINELFEKYNIGFID